MSVLADRISVILKKFDSSSKVQLAKELAEILELQGEEVDLQDLMQSALGRNLSKEELSKIRILELVLRDKGLGMAGRFPDDTIGAEDGIGAPKVGR